MRLTIADVEADPTLPGWMLDPAYPSWMLDDRYRDITELEFCSAMMEVRRGCRDQASFNQLISHRKHNAARKAKKQAAADALPPEVRAENELRKRRAQRLARCTSQVTMWKNRIADAVERNDMLAKLSMDSYQMHLREAERVLAEHVTQALQAEFARIIP